MNRCLLFALLSLSPIAVVCAQNSSLRDSASTTATTHHRSQFHVFGLTLDRVAPTNTFSVWGGSSVATYTANANENMHGSLRIAGVQWAHDIFAWRGARFSWITEVLPVIEASSGAPPGRTPKEFRDPATAENPTVAWRYRQHDSRGFGFAPLSAQAELPMTRRLSAVVHVTSGVALFNNVVPFGRATEGVFTVSPGVAVQWEPTATSRLGFGYSMHHLSNASIGQTNPGMNSHLFYLRLSSRRVR